MDKTLLIIVLSIILTSCNSSEKNSIWTKKYCNLERLEFQEITDTIQVNKDGGFQSGVSVNGKVVLNEKINLDTVKAYLNGGNKVFLNQTTLKVVKVSQEFYDF